MRYLYMSEVITNMKHYGLSHRKRKRPDSNFVTINPMYFLLDMDDKNNTQIARFE